MRVLFVLPIVPWPVRRNGISLRFAPLIGYLAEKHQLDIIIVADEREALVSEWPLTLCHSVTLLDTPYRAISGWSRRVRTLLLGLLPWGPPLGSMQHVDRRKFVRQLTALVNCEDYDSIVWASRHLEVACALARRCPNVRLVADLVDSPSLQAERLLSSPVSVRWLRNYGSWKLRRLERRVQQTFDATIYVSQVDAQTVRSRHAQVHVVPNPIYAADFNSTAHAASGTHHVIGFLGNMSYGPNVSAALRLATRIFPLVQAQAADASVLIIGRDPAPAVRDLQCSNIHITGTVDNTWPWVSKVDVFVFPMLEGSGLQNKILEAMFAGVPVITTGIAASGLGALNSRHLLIGETDDEIALLILRVLTQPQLASQMAARARAFVLEQFSPPAVFAQYEALLLPDAQWNHAKTA